MMARRSMIRVVWFLWAISLCSVCLADSYCPIQYVGQWNGVYYYNCQKTAPLTPPQTCSQTGEWVVSDNQLDTLSSDCNNCATLLYRLNYAETCMVCQPTERGRRGRRRYYVQNVQMFSRPQPDDTWEAQKRRGFKMQNYVSAWDGSQPGVQNNTTTPSNFTAGNGHNP